MFTITPPPPPHLVWEVVGSEVVVLDTTSHTTHRLTGNLAKAFLAAASGHPISTQEVMALQERGFLEPRSPLTRRSLITAGGVGIGLGITSLTLPTVAIASSSSSLPVTAFVFDAAFGDWRWQQLGTTLRLFQSSGASGLKEDDIFVPGETWTATLINADGKQAAAPVVGTPGIDLTLTFDYLDTPAGSYPATLRVQLTRNTGTEILQSQEFDVIAF